MAQASMEMDDSKRCDLDAQAEKLMLYDNAVICPVLYSVNHEFIYDYVKNYPQHPMLTAGYRYVYTSGRAKG
jgi:oligopeptide transport system substrate-binding protein